MPIVEIAEARWFLTALDGARAGMVWPINGTVTIGRHGDIELEGPHISRELLRLRAARTVRARRVGRSACSAGVFFRRPLPAGKWITLRRRTIIAAGEKFRLDERPRPRSPLIWVIALSIVATAVLVPFVLSGPAWRMIVLLAPIVLLAQALRRRHRRITPLRAPLAILVSSHEGRAFHSEPHLPVRSLRTPLEGTGWVVRDELTAIWLAGYLAVWNDPEVLAVTSPWVTTTGSGIEVRFGYGPPSRDSAAITWGPRPQWALPLRLAPSWRATALWARQLHLRQERVPEVYTFDEAVAHPHRSGLQVALAHGEDGPLMVDLSRAPHALVSGATGSGKSELLVSWLLLMAQHNSPRSLQMVLIDFKGGATGSALRGLPHLVDIATDLDAAGARRMVTSLKATLRQRERVLVEHGAREFSELQEPPARLVIVVDEFRALADDVPDALDQLVRLAAQGRSLGVHLILASQRPGGVVTADMRANIPLRIALSTIETSDSFDLIGTDAAARLPRIPGRAILVHNGLQTVQVAWTPGPAAVVAHTATRWNEPPPAPPWLPALPERVCMSEVPDGIAVVDHPDALAYRTYSRPNTHLLVIGPHDSGLTTAARTCATSAWRAGHAVWLISADPWSGPGPGFGGTIHPSETRLVSAILDHAPRVNGVIVLDDVEAWSAVHDSLHGHGSADAQLENLLRSNAHGVLLTHSITPRWGRGITERIHLAGLDSATASLSGLSREAQEVLLTPIPGRAVIGGKTAQIALPDISGLAPPPPLQVRSFTPLPKHPILRARSGMVCVGHDGDDYIYIRHGSIAVVGPRGSGRSETAEMIASQMPDAVVLESPQIGPPLPSGIVIATASPETWAGSFGGVLGHLRAHAPLLALRPDLCPRITPEIESQLEPGSPGYAVLVDGGRARALRLCRLIETG